MHKKQCKSETNVNFNADKINIISKGAEKMPIMSWPLQLKLKPKKRLLEEQKSTKRS
jgi:hypothetical protein